MRALVVYLTDQWQRGGVLPASWEDVLASAAAYHDAETDGTASGER